MPRDCSPIRVATLGVDFELHEPPELVAMDGEVRLELRDHCRERADVATERVDPLTGGLDLGREHALLLLGRLDLVAQAGDPPVELGLAVGGRLRQRRRHGQRDERPEKACDYTDAASVNHRDDFGENAGVPARPHRGFGLERPLL